MSLMPGAETCPLTAGVFDPWQVLPLGGGALERVMIGLKAESNFVKQVRPWSALRTQNLWPP